MQIKTAVEHDVHCQTDVTKKVIPHVSKNAGKWEAIDC